MCWHLFGHTHIQPRRAPIGAILERHLIQTKGGNYTKLKSIPRLPEKARMSEQAAAAPPKPGQKGEVPTRGKSKNACAECNKNVTKKEKGMMCDICDHWYHANCQQVSNAMYQVITEEGEDQVSWYCTHCRRRAKKIMSHIALISQRQDTVEKSVTKLGEDHTALEKRVKQLETQGNAQQRPSEPTNDNATTSIVQEIAERQQRTKNLILFNVNESNGETAEERKSSYKAAITKIVTEGLAIPQAEFQISNTARLGKYEATRTRPLKVTLETETQRSQIIRKGKQLRESTDGNLNSVFIAPDLTPTQRLEAKKLREERTAKNGELVTQGDRAHIWVIRTDRLIKVKKREAPNQEND